MRCQYTFLETERRYGVPQAAGTTPVVLVGCYASVGIMIRAILDKVGEEGGWTMSLLQNMVKIAFLLGEKLEIKKKGKEEGGEISFCNEEMQKLTSLAALPRSDLEFHGGKLSRAEYLKKDPTFNEKYFKYGQSEAEMKNQRGEMAEKRKRTRDRQRAAASKHAKFFHIGLPNSESGEKSVTTPINLKDLKASGFLDHRKDVHLLEIENAGLKIALSGGSTHNKEATKKFFGTRDSEVKLKDEVVVICTGKATLNIDDCIEPDPTWLEKFKNSEKPSKKTTVSSKKVKKEESAPFVCGSC